MKNLFARDCIETDNVVYVLEEQRPSRSQNNALFAVFTEIASEKGRFCGLVTPTDISLHPERVFADLCGQRSDFVVPPDMPIEQTLAMLDIHNCDAVPVLDGDTFVGVITRTGIFENLVQRKRQLLDESREEQKQLEEECQQALSLSGKLTEMHVLSRDLLANLANISFENDAMERGLSALANLLQCQHAAMSVLTKDGQLKNIIHIGFNQNEIEHIHQIANETLRETSADTDIRLIQSDDKEDYQTSLEKLTPILIVPITFQGRDYGHIYLGNKVSGEPFDKNDELFTSSFAHTLSLAFDNARNIEEVETARRNLDYLAHFDVLTGLPNRALLVDRMRQLISQMVESQTSPAVLFIDLDDFKIINDSMGHQVGDDLLKLVAERLPKILGANDTLTRFAGDEFVVLMPSIDEPIDVAVVAENIINSFHEPFVVDGAEIFISVSVGIAMFPDEPESVDRILADADTALHHAKSLGKNQYHFFSSEMNSSVHNHFELERHLRRAIDKNELGLFYQPMIDIVSGDTIGFEALLRWQSQEYGAVSPTIFIPLAERSGLIVSIGEWVINAACKQAKAWFDMDCPARIAVNLSARQFLYTGQQQKSLFNIVANAIERYALPPELLELEITENIMMHHLNESLSMLDKLKQLGVKISIDDFGTGYSSLSYIKKFPIDSLKIDKSFIDDLVFDENDAAIVTAIIAMAKQLNLDVVVEGVETEEQLQFFKDKGYNVTVQGYYFCRPLPAQDINYVYQ